MHYLIGKGYIMKIFLGIMNNKIEPTLSEIPLKEIDLMNLNTS